MNLREIKEMKSLLSTRARQILAAAFLVATIAPSFAKEPPTPQSLTPAEAFAAVKEEFGVDIKTVFATRCAACHLGQGTQRGDGPMLAGTSLDFARVIERIVKGKTPMPGFGGTLSDEQLMGLARFIVSLKPPGQ
jgi:mono/diheme cytochrome c family protein